MNAPPKTLLLIDNNPQFRQLLSHFCKEQGYQVDAYSNFHAAIGPLEQRLYDLIILDLDLPVIDGAQALGILSGFATKTPIILTHQGDESILLALKSAAARRHTPIRGTLRKPFDLDQLSQLLNSEPAQAEQHQACRHTNSLELFEIFDLVNRNRIACVYQPKINLRTGLITGLEVLARLKGARGELISPDRFIPQIEDKPFINVFNEQLLDQALRLQRRLIDRGLELDMAINISAHSLLSETFPDDLEDKLQHHQIDPRKITLEITESHAISHSSQSLIIMARLRIKGFKLSIDDFGTGYSSLSTFNEVPFNELKIDKCFTQELGQSRKAQKIFELAIRLAQDLNITAVAEGIEDASTEQLAKQMGCHTGQGYHYSKPLEEAALLKWLNQQETNSSNAASLYKL